MRKLFSLFQRKTLWDFPGGIHPPEQKTQTSGIPLRSVPLPAQMIIPLQQHMGSAGELLVKVGDRVLKGLPLTRGTGRTLPVHAPTSGVITKVADHTTAHPSGIAEKCIFLEPDGEDRWDRKTPCAHYQSLSASELLTRIHQAGIAGLGGAGFPTAAKLASGKSDIVTLIINAAECEPYITADDRLMQEHADEIILGCQILAHLLSPKQVLIGIEDNKPAAIKALETALRGITQIELKVVPTKYPSGAAGQLTTILTGQEIPHDQHSAALGILMQNVGTAYAIKRAIIDGEPLIERIVTLAGQSLQRPGNLRARLGTPVAHLLHHAGYTPQGNQPMVIMGGPLMGFTLPDLNVPVVKISNCILAPSAEEFAPPQPEQSCIRCGECAKVCPVNLLPQQLFWFSQGKEHEKARQHHLFDCIECGACAYVCPSQIPLVHYYRKEKAIIRQLDEEATLAQQAKQRFEARKSRLEKEKLARQQRHESARQRPSSSDKSSIEAAMQRIKAKQQANGEGTKPSLSPSVISEQEGVVAQARFGNEAITRLRFAGHTEQRISLVRPVTSQVAAPQVKSPPKAEPSTQNQAKVAEAIARVRARKAQQAEIAQRDSREMSSVEMADPNKAAVAAAIARVKARKTQQNAQEKQPLSDALDGVGDDPHKAAVAAALARVKARKAQSLLSPHDTDKSPVTELRKSDDAL